MRLVSGFDPRVERQPFPFLFGGAFIEAAIPTPACLLSRLFPFLFGGAFIEAVCMGGIDHVPPDFPSFSEGLSLRREKDAQRRNGAKFPFLFGGAFIEAGFRVRP